MGTLTLRKATNPMTYKGFQMYDRSIKVSCARWSAYR